MFIPAKINLKCNALFNGFVGLFCMYTLITVNKMVKREQPLPFSCPVFLYSCSKNVCYEHIFKSDDLGTNLLNSGIVLNHFFACGYAFLCGSFPRSWTAKICFRSHYVWHMKLCKFRWNVFINMNLSWCIWWQIR